MNRQTAPVNELLSRSWQEYKERALTILAVMLITSALLSFIVMIIALCVLIGVPIMTHFTGERTAILLIMILVSVSVMIFFILAIWSQATLVAVIMDDELGIIDAFQKGWDYLWPMTWVLTILSGILITGFSLAILPGFLFLVWFSLCVFILFDGEHSPMDTLLLSREYVRGHGWNTFGKLLLIWFLAAVVGIIPFIGQVISILFTPFCLLFMLNLYRDLKDIKGELAVEPGGGARVFWWLVTAIGLVLPVLAVAGGIIALFTSNPQWLETIPHGMDGLSI